MDISIEDWQARGRSLRHSGHPVFYVDEGQGEALLLIHGFPTSSWDWVPLWPQLTAQYCCIAPDMMGFGFSAKPYNYAYSIMDQADMLEALLDALELTRVHILAHDYGDTVAQELLARFLQRQSSAGSGVELRSICFLNGGLFPEVHRARLVQKLLNSPLGPLLSRVMNRRSFNRSFSAIFAPANQPSDSELQSFWQLLSRDRGVRITHKLIRYINERRRYRERWVGALQQASIPLRLIDGAVDPVSGRHMAERYRELVPQPDVVVLEEVGHYPQVEAPVEVLAAYQAFRRAQQG